MRPFPAWTNMKNALIADLPISTANEQDVLESMARSIDARSTGHIVCITNTETLYHGLHNPVIERHIRTADFSLCDGVGVVVAGWAWGHNVSRITGPNLQLAASSFGQSRKWRHFFYGGKEGVAEQMAARLTAKYPELIVCGTYSPPFKALSVDEDQSIVDRINATQPDIVWVGLGLPKQETWIQEHVGRVNAPWMIGVGAAFDYHAGTVPWAPPIFRAIGLEWVFRLAREPRLRAPRYARSLVFVMRAGLEGLLKFRFLRPTFAAVAEASRPRDSSAASR